MRMRPVSIQVLYGDFRLHAKIELTLMMHESSDLEETLLAASERIVRLQQIYLFLETLLAFWVFQHQPLNGKRD